MQVVEDENVTKDLDQYANGLIKRFEKLQILSKKDFNETLNNLKNLKNPVDIANNISSNLNIQIFEKQELLEITDLKKRLEKIHAFIEKEQAFICREKIRGRVKIKWKKRKENII